MPFLQAGSYPVSVMATNVAPPPTKEAPRTATVKAAPPGVAAPGTELPLSNRVKAFLATEPRPREEPNGKQSADAEAAAPRKNSSQNGGVQFDDASNYQPDWMY